jgi:hypothetical protein
MENRGRGKISKGKRKLWVGSLTQTTIQSVQCRKDLKAYFVELCLGRFIEFFFVFFFFNVVSAFISIEVF